MDEYEFLERKNAREYEEGHKDPRDVSYSDFCPFTKIVCEDTGGCETCDAKE